MKPMWQKTYCNFCRQFIVNSLTTINYLCVLILLQALQEKHKLLALTDELKKQLDERANEAAVLKEQNAVYAADFQLEREDRERSQSRLIELEGQLAAASRRIADLEDDRQRYLTTVTTTRHLVSVLLSWSFLFI